MLFCIGLALAGIAAYFAFTAHYFLALVLEIVSGLLVIVDANLNQPASTPGLSANRKGGG